MLDLILLAIQWCILVAQAYSFYHCERNNLSGFDHWYGISLWGFIPSWVLCLIILLN